MKLMKRIVLGVFALALALAFCVTPADAATKSSKKKTEKKAEKKEEKKSEPKHMSHSSSGSNTYLSGTNTWGRSGLLFADTSEVAGIGNIEGAAHLTYSSPASGFSNVNIPFGGHFGVANNLELSAAGVIGIFSSPAVTILGFTYGGDVSTFGIDLGAKYKIDLKGNGPTPSLSVGGDILIPTNGGSAIVTPRGTISYTLNNGMLLNGDVGIHIAGGSYVSVDAGVGVPLSNNFTGIVELGANQAGNGGSMLGGGVRVGSGQFKFQGLLGIPLNGGGVQIGGGVILGSI